MMTGGALYGAWEATHPPTGGTWDDIDVTSIGGEDETQA